MKVFVAVDIGCIECAESSSILGVFKNKRDAERVLNAAEKIQEADWKGEHHFFVEEVEIT